MKRVSVIFQVHDCLSHKDTYSSSVFMVENETELGIAIQLETEALLERNFTIIKVEVLKDFNSDDT
jgi:hypothetical protein